MLFNFEREIILGNGYRLVHWYKPDGSTWAVVSPKPYARGSYFVATTKHFTVLGESEARAWAEKVIGDLGGNEAVIGFSPEQMERARKGMGVPRAETVPCAKCGDVTPVGELCLWISAYVCPCCYRRELMDACEFLFGAPLAGMSANISRAQAEAAKKRQADKIENMRYLRECALCDAQVAVPYVWFVNGNAMYLCPGCYRNAARLAIGSTV